MPHYQTFSDTTGDSDSAAKLEQLQLPPDLAGQSVLDIGCNEGFFCQEAWRRGASHVVGVDRNGDFIERARRRDSRTDYRLMDWTDLRALNESFDLILFLSSLHYATEPEVLLRLVLDLLRPGGLLVLECGIAPGSHREWVRVERPAGDVVLHPTRAMVIEALKDASVRYVGRSVDQPGDSVERHVFHVTPLKPTVLLISGEGSCGKSTLARKLTWAMYTNVSLDHLLVTLPEWCRDESLLSLQASRSFDPNRLEEFVALLTEHRAEEQFAEEVLSSERVFPNNRPGLTVIEGYALSRGNFRAAFAERLKERGYYVWSVEPADAEA